MAYDGGGSPHQLLVESWSMFSVAIALYLLRMYVRFRRLGWRLQPEDWIMTASVGWYTAFVVTNVQLSTSGGGSLYRPEEFATFTPEEIQLREKNSRLEFGSEHCMINAISWPKACMLFMYYRITSNSSHSMLVKICAVYTFLGYIATLLTLFLNCHPISGYWTIPPPQQECATYFRFEIVQAVFNISSDLAILAVIIPLLWKLKMTKQDKLPLIFIFSLGFALVLCAVISKVFTFIDIFDPSYQFWYLREASCAMYICNLPYIWGFVRHEVLSFHGSASSKGRGKSLTSGGHWPASNQLLSSNGDTFHHVASASRAASHIHVSGNESEEHIMSDNGDVRLTTLKDNKVAGGGITRTTEIQVSRKRCDDSDY